MFRRGLILVVTVLTLAACVPTGPVEFGTLEPAKDSIKVPASTTGRNAPEEWPDACRMLTDDEVKSVFPRAPVESRSIPVQSLPSGREAPRGACEFELSLAGTTPSEHVLMSLEIQDLAEPRFVTTNFDNEKADSDVVTDYGTRLGAEDCYAVPPESAASLDTPTLSCRQGPVAFSLEASSNEHVDIQADGDKAKTQRLFDDAVTQFPQAIVGKFPQRQP